MIASAQMTIVDLNDPIQQGTAPTNPTEGMLWLNTSESPPQLYRWTGKAWEAINQQDIDIGGTNLAARSKISAYKNIALTCEDYLYT